MKVTLPDAIVDYDNQPIEVNEKPLKPQVVMINALGAKDEGETLTPEQTLQIYEVSARINKAKKQVDLDIDSIKRIRDNVGKVYSPMISGQIIQLLEGKNEDSNANS